MRTLVIGDIHGGLLALQQVLVRAKISKNDRLIFLGDYVDGWSQSPQVLDFLIELKEEYDCIFMRGNHDELALHWLQTKIENPKWLSHGGNSTVLAYSKIPEHDILSHIDFLSNLENYYLDPQNRLFVHAGFTNVNGIHQEHTPRGFYWDRTLWEMALALDKSLPKDHIYFPKRLALYDEIYIGHTDTTRIQSSEPVNMANVWNVDTGAAYKGKITVLDIHSKLFWQSDLVYELYPNELGRN